MSSGLRFMLACLAGPGFSTAGRVPGLSDQVFHPGYLATHVTRLHRNDHSGLSAMLEAEARWHQDHDLAELRSPSRSFVTLSERQAEGLRIHHQATMVQVTAEERQQTHSSSSALAAAKSTLRTFSRYGSWRGAELQAPAVTGLSSLDSQYVGPIGVGTVMSPAGCSPKKGASLVYLPATGTSELERKSCHVEDQSQVWVVFDTGSTNIWVASDLCRQGPCALPERRRYDHTKSSTYQPPFMDVDLNIQFGTGKISGPQAVDDFHIGPFTIYNQTFGMIEVQDGKVFEEVPFEGILGLAFPKMSANGVTPFFDNIIKQKAMHQNEFAFYFSLDTPAANAVFWGGVDPAFYTGNIEYFPVVDPFYWSLPLVSFKIGGDELSGLLSSPGSFLERDSRPGRQTEIKAIVDTGTTFFTAEGRLYDEILKRLPSADCSRITDQSHPPITYQLRSVSGAARDFVLKSSQYMTSSNTGSSGLCAPAFMRITIPAKHGPALVLGEVFLRHFFGVFDRGNGDETQARIGFARAAHGEKTLKRLKDLTRSQPAFDAAHAQKVI